MNREIEIFARRSSLIKYITKMKKSGYSPMVLVCGMQGAGKSMTALAIAYALKHKGLYQFDMDKNLMHDVGDFVKRLLDGKKNQAIILDEAQIRLNSKEYWSDFNIAFEKIIASQRYLGNIYLVVLPLAIGLAKANRRFVDIKVEMYRKKLAKWSYITKRYGEMGFTGRKAIFESFIPTRMVIPQLPDDIIHKYKKIERRDKRQILEDIGMKLNIIPNKRKEIVEQQLDLIQRKKELIRQG